MKPSYSPFSPNAVISINAFILYMNYLLGMIRLTQKGSYQLRQTDEETKLLTLNKRNYALTANSQIVYIPGTLFKKGTNRLLHSGAYRLYTVKNEENLSTALHLELFTDKTDNSYLLPSGLPTGKTSPKVILKTTEVITKLI